MKQNSEDEQALLKIQHDWTKARIKGDSSYTRRLEAENCTVVWPDGSIVNKREDLKSMSGDIVFAEFKIDDLQVRLYGDAGVVVGQGTIRAHEGKQNLLGGKFVWTDTFIKQDGAWKVVSRHKSLQS
jgi:ketosteroid isomerase-like protein